MIPRSSSCASLKCGDKSLAHREALCRYTPQHVRSRVVRPTAIFSFSTKTSTFVIVSGGAETISASAFSLIHA